MSKLRIDRSGIIVDSQKVRDQAVELCKIARAAQARAAAVVAESKMVHEHSCAERQTSDKEMKQCRAEIAALLNDKRVNTGLGFPISQRNEMRPAGTNLIRTRWTFLTAG